MNQTQEDQIKKLDVDPYKASGSFQLKVSIKGVELLPTIINVVTIREFYDFVIPRLSMTITDSGIFLDMFPLEEGDEIEIYLALNRDQDPLKATFLVECFNIINSGGGNTHTNFVEISAILKTKEMFIPNKTRSFGALKSSDLIAKLATEVGLKSEVRVTSNDSMKWLQINSVTYSFIRNILERAYVAEDDLVLAYSQCDSNLVYTTLSKELQNKVKYEAVFDRKETLNDSPDDANKQNKDNKDYIYFNDYELVNMSSVINKAEGGYGETLVYYEEGKEVNKLLSSNVHKLTTHSTKVKKDIGKVTKVNYMGSFNNRNLHRNYFDAVSQNNRNSIDFFCNDLILNIKARTDLKLLEKVNVTLLGNNEGVNNVHSGEYLIGGIVYLAASSNNFTMKLLLHRNGHNNKYSMLDSKDIKLG